MRSKITSKFQTTIPREVREKLKLGISDIIEWRLDGSKIYVEPVEKPFLKYRGSIKPKGGDAKTDIQTARKKRAQELISK